MKTPYLDRAIETLKNSYFSDEAIKECKQEYEAIKERLLTDEELEPLKGILTLFCCLCNEDDIEISKEENKLIEKILRK